MFYIEKHLEISASHSLSLGYDSKCSNIHGHNWNIVIYGKSKTLNEFGMIEDFSLIKQTISKKLDHKNLNDVFDFNPTAENIAFWICSQISTCYKVSVQESSGNVAIYEKDNV